MNEDNGYNQNYKGVYCTCSRPYPDPEDATPDEMIQCIVCEDWFHGRHLDGISNLPRDDSYGEMICHLCANEHKDIFSAYQGLAVSVVGKLDGTDADLDVSVADEANASRVEDEQDPKSGADDKDSKDKVGESSKSCPRKSIGGEIPDQKISALFLPNGWREQLCRCGDCIKMYDEKRLEFLIDPEDTVHFYESQSSAESGTQYEAGMKALSSMDRIKQVEAIQSYNEMKESLKSYLKKFADEGKVVGEEDIQEFFRNMSQNSAKRQKLEIPKFCR